MSKPEPDFRKRLAILAEQCSLDAFARMILARFHHLKIHANAALPRSMFQHDFENAGLQPSDCTDGIDHGVMQGWFTKLGTSVTLTTQGYKEIHGDGPPLPEPDFSLPVSVSERWPYDQQ